MSDKRMTLTEAAQWCDEEYGALSRWRGAFKGDAAHQLTGKLAMLAELSALLRSWSATGHQPPHQKPPRTETSGCSCVWDPLMNDFSGIRCPVHGKKSPPVIGGRRRQP